MRADARALIDDLTRLYGDKLGLLNRLLLNESDKLFYARAENIDHIAELLEEDAALIERINRIDCDIAETGRRLASLAGVTFDRLYEHIPGEEGDLHALRGKIRECLKSILSQRSALDGLMRHASRGILDGIKELDRQERLRGSLDRHGDETDGE